MSYTKGPWQCDTNAFPLQVLSADGDVICAGMMPSGIDNARLIAAAPIMADYIRRRADAGDIEAAAIIEKATKP